MPTETAIGEMPPTNISAAAENDRLKSEIVELKKKIEELTVISKERDRLVHAINSITATVNMLGS